MMVVISMELMISKKQNKKGRKTLRQNQNNDTSYRLVTSPRGFAFAPDSIIVDLNYFDSTINRVNVGNKFSYWRIRMNSIFDPDPLLLTGAVSGFVEWAALYRKYTVLSCEVDSTIVNKETFPVGITAAPSDLDLVTIVTGPAAAEDMSELPYAIPTKIISTTGGVDKIRFRKRIDLAKFTGLKEAYIGSTTYSSLVNANPAVILFWNLALFTDTNMVSGVFQSTKYHYRVLFSQRQPVLA